MSATHAPRLVSVNIAFERIGRTFVEGWTGEERAVAPLGSRTKAKMVVWQRGYEARRRMHDLARDNRVGVVMYDGKGGRRHYYEHAEAELAALLIPPDPDAAGLIELANGTVFTCEFDISRISLRSMPRAKPGPKNRFSHLDAACDEYLLLYGPGTNSEIISHLCDRLTDGDFPKSDTTLRRRIDEARERFRNHNLVSGETLTAGL